MKKHEPGPPMTLGNMRELGMAPLDRSPPQRHMPKLGPDRRVTTNQSDGSVSGAVLDVLRAIVDLAVRRIATIR